MLATYLANVGSDELGNLPRQVAAVISAGVSEDTARALRAFLPGCTTARCGAGAAAGRRPSRGPGGLQPRRRADARVGPAAGSCCR